MGYPALYHQNPLPSRTWISIFNVRLREIEIVSETLMIGRTQSHGSVQCYDRILIDGLPGFTRNHGQWNARSS